MRFFRDGPSIPDDLLIARDQGRVVFFCGAGVSMACAGLPGFFGLAETVIHKLGVSTDSAARIILNEAREREIENRTGVTGLISADRIFGLLERDFLGRDIEAAVAQALRPSPGVNLSAHQILLDLATTPEGKVRLVTTNFDRLFEDCGRTLKVWQPPRLPDPARDVEMDGIIYLHGYTTKDYTGADGDGFILSSSEFGRAYLSDGWATKFFRGILSRYVVVFVGYTADDPPVHYLLEALNKRNGNLDGVYAFQSGLANEAAAKWLHKGVEAIPYAENGDHRVLWESLAAWAKRAMDPENWYRSVVDLARKGPEQLCPHERGQVAHVISTPEGARKFSEGDKPPPADWLCVFDPYRRYANPEHSGDLSEKPAFVDPFELYGLDRDIVPKPIQPDDRFEKRAVPTTAWDGLAANRLDRKNLRDESFSAVRGHWSTNVPILPSRLTEIGRWIAKIADHPAAVWWAACQFGLHPHIQDQIKWQLDHSHRNIESVIRQAWRYLFEAWKENRRDYRREWHDLKAAIDKDGWNSAAIRKLAAIKRPYLKAEPSWLNRPKPPNLKKNLSIRHILRLSVEYPLPRIDAEIADEWLAFAVRELRKNLEYALYLETEIGGSGLTMIGPIIPDGVQDDRYGRKRGLSGSVISFSGLFQRLSELDVTLAKQEFKAWPVDDDTIFSRLRIWASGKDELVSAQDLGLIIAELSDGAFWDERHQRDLLLVLATRWRDLPEQTRKQIENRLVLGPAKWAGEEDVKFRERKAWRSLHRLRWLADNGCPFSFVLDTEIGKLQSSAPEWKPEYAAKAAESMEGRSGWVKTNTEHSALLDEPIAGILTKAYEMSGRADDLLENDPFAGLSAECPLRAFSALRDAAKKAQYPVWAWRTFLNSEGRKHDKAKFSALVAERISRFPDDAVAEFVYPASEWVLNISHQLGLSFPQTFDRIVAKLIIVFRGQPSSSNSAVIRGLNAPDWTLEAINAPVGKVAQALMNDPQRHALQRGDGFPTGWLERVHELLELTDDLRRHALVIFASHLNWFYAIDPMWTEASMLSVMDENDGPDQCAIWSGFLWRATFPDTDLFMRLKRGLLAFAKEASLPHGGYSEILAGLILAGWGTVNQKTGDRCISDAEMRDVLLHTGDEFRSHVLWQVDRWSKSEDNGAGERWSLMLLELLQNVWPRQKSAKTSGVSALLCELAFSKIDRFPETAKVILPLLTTVDRDYLILPELINEIIDLYPRESLEILHAILPDDVSTWPFGIEARLHRIGEVDTSLRQSERFLELFRKWNSR